MRREQARGIQAILTGDLDAESAFVDLVYVFGTLIEQGLAAAGELLLLFQDLWALRGQSDAEAVPRTRAIQADLRAGFLPLRGPGEEELPDEGSKSDAGG